MGRHDNWNNGGKGRDEGCTAKTSGHEKVRITVNLTAKADGIKLKPFIVFSAAKRESKALHDEFKSKRSIASTANGWMNEELTLRWVDEILGKFPFSKGLWDTYEAHLTDQVKQRLRDYKVDQSLIPGGCTRYIQAPDVSWNKPLKE